MILRNGRGRIRKLWGGYSLKVFDEHFLEIGKRWFEKRLAGAGVVADQHFEWGKKNFKKVKFYTTHHEPRFNRKNTTKEEDDDNEEDEEYFEATDLTTLTKKQQSFNSALYKLRARVEMPFGESKTMFALLRTHWKRVKINLTT